MGDNREFDVLGIFWGVLLIFGVGELMTIEDPSLSAHGYQLLSLATSYFVGNNRKFDISEIFWGVLSIVGGGAPQNMSETSNSLLLPTK